MLVATQGGNLASAAGSALWIDGVYYAVTPSHGTTGVATGNTEPLLLGTRSDTYSYMRGSMALAMGFPRVMRDQEIASLSDNPWQVFAP